MAGKSAQARLLERAKAGDPEAFIELTEPYRRRMYAIVARMVGRADAEDVVQEAFIRAFRSIGRFRGDASLSTWLTRIAINLAIRHSNKQRRRATDSLDALDWEEPSEDPPRTAHAMAIRQAVADLSPKLRAAVVLFYFEGLSLDETAEALDINRGTAASRLHEARRRLRERLGQAYDREQGWYAE
jgi:RNA polymerase sigma-70 factor (ECF subfamily)